MDSFGTYNDIWQTIMWIGIVSKDHRLNQDFGNKNDAPYCCRGIKQAALKLSAGIFCRPDTLYLVPNIEYELLLVGTTALFQTNGRQICEYNTHLTIDTRYKLALCIAVKDAKFTLIDFCIE